MKRIEIKGRHLEFSIRQWQLFLFVFLAFFMIQLPELHITLSSDGYSRMYSNDPALELLTGRTVSYLTQVIFAKLHLSIVFHQQIFFFCFLVMLSLSTCLLLNCVLESLDKAPSPVLFAAVLVAILYSFTNLIFQEYFYFSEVYFLWGLGTILWVLALRCLYVLPRKLGILAGFFFLYLSVSCYQIWLQPFIIWGLAILIIKYKRLNKALFLSAVKLCLIGVAALAANLIVMRLIGKTGVELGPRGTSLSMVSTSYNMMKNVIKYSFKRFPEDMVSVVLVPLLILAVALFVSVLIRKTGNRVNRAILLMIYLSVCWLITYGMHLFESHPWIVPRAVPGVASTVACLLILLVLESEQRKWHVALFSVASVFLLISITLVQTVTINTIAGNRLDEREAIAMDMAITAYEEESGIKVTSLVRTFDSNATNKHPEVYSFVSYLYGYFVWRPAIVNWSYAPSIEYFTGRSFEEISTDRDAHQEFFDNKQWDYFNPTEQLYFDGSTVYWCVY
jgi:hypothetical protein